MVGKPAGNSGSWGDGGGCQGWCKWYTLGELEGENSRLHQTEVSESRHIVLYGRRSSTEAVSGAPSRTRTPTAAPPALTLAAAAAVAAAGRSSIIVCGVDKQPTRAIVSSLQRDVCHSLTSCTVDTQHYLQIQVTSSHLLPVLTPVYMCL